MTVCYWCGAKDTLADIGKELDDGKYKMVKCKKCKTAYYVLNKAKQKTNEKTNEEYLKSCTTEQLAEWLQEHMDCASCGCNKDLCYQGYDCCKLAFIEWLKQPHTPKE